MIAFVLGLFIGYLIAWFFRKKQSAEPVGPTEDTSAAYADRDRDSDFGASAPAGGSFPAATATGGGAAAIAADDEAAAFDADSDDTSNEDFAADVSADEAASPEAAVAPEEQSTEDAATAVAAEEEPAAAAVDGSGDGQVTQPAMTMIGAAGAVSPTDDATPAAEAEAAVPAEAPYGPGSVVPLAGGAAPSPEYTVKGNADSGLYYTTESPYYKRTKAEVWFKTAGDAQAAGFLPWDHRRNGAGASAEAAPEASPEPAAPEAPAAPVQPAAATAGAIGGVILGGAAGEVADEDSDADTGAIPAQAPGVAAPAPAETTAEPVAAEPVAEPVAEATPEPASTPFDPGSALPLDGGGAPSGDYTVKGNADSMLYHTIESPYYPRTVAEVWFKSASDAEGAGFTAWNARRKQQRAVAEPTWEPGVYPGSAKPKNDGSAPAPAFTVKGNEDSMLYHTIESPYYTRTVAEIWFKSANEAESAGFTAWNGRR